jgi:pimeloyl-ACP methyl ester carboxylesterase
MAGCGSCSPVAGSVRSGSRPTPVLWPGGPAAALAWYRAAGPSTLRVPAVAVPTCHLWGSGDAALGRRATEATARWVAGSDRLHSLDGAGHWLPEQHATERAGPVLGHARQWPIARADGQGWAS